jgi:hypothetical protein
MTAHGAVGWALCGVTMGIGMAATTLEHALVIHDVAAAAFLAVVVVFDFCIVALVIERSLAMFRSPLGTWLPFVLIFLAS